MLEALGVNINLRPSEVERMIEEIGIAFLYAPLFHPVMGKVLPPEQDLGIKTIFYSVIGPLINPAFAPRHLLGVYKPELLDTVSYVAKALGYTNAMFVHGLDGLDEISLLGKTRINHLKNGEVNTIEIAPEDFGLTPDLEKTARDFCAAGVYALLFDPRTPDNAATGGAADLSAFIRLRRAVNCPVMLAGGIRPENVAEIVQKTGAQMIDLMTGVECRPGVKEEVKVAALFRALQI